MVCGSKSEHVCHSLFPFLIPTEDAKRLAIKEEQYDPGYEDAYGGAYVERGPEGNQGQSQVNGHCTFASAENAGNNTLMLQKPEEKLGYCRHSCTLLSKCIFSLQLQTLRLFGHVDDSEQFLFVVQLYMK